MPSDYLRNNPRSANPDNRMTVLGAYGVEYNAGTVWAIDGNLECLPSNHADVDRLLDARNLVSVLDYVFPSTPCTMTDNRS